jgi:hypothetical protein
MMVPLLTSSDLRLSPFGRQHVQRSAAELVCQVLVQQLLLVRGESVFPGVTAQQLGVVLPRVLAASRLLAEK